ncbi:GNAT family N-acetyltransferase [Devosia sp. CAU 1758]
MQENLAHLTVHGDCIERGTASFEDIAAELASEQERHWRYGIHIGGELAGRVDLLGVEPPRYGIGYWLAACHAGRGVATEAVRAVVDFAAEERGASIIFCWRHPREHAQYCPIEAAGLSGNRAV